MERSLVPYKSLPDEFLLTLFHSATEDQLATYTLVCKAWKKRAQSVLYSNVTIDSISRLRKFHETVKNSAHLGDKVKVFNLKIKLPYNSRKNAHNVEIAEASELLSNLLSLCLPNLEELKEDTLNSYIPVLSALKNSRLKHLKRLNTPTRDMEKKEVANYASCILLMQDRAENIAIAEGKGESVKLESHSLYSKLDQFDKLTELDTRESKTLCIQDLEHIIATCKSLKKLKFKSGLYADNSIPTNAIPNVIPSHSIKSIEGELEYIKDEKMLLYIMQKFPQLHELSLDMSEFVNQLKHDTIIKTLNYSTGIDTFSVRELRVDDRRTMGIIKDFWKATNSKNGSKSVKMGYYDIPEGDDRLAIEKSRDVSKVSFIYFASEFYDDKQKMKFIEENGKYVGAFHLDYSTDDHVVDLPYKCDLPKTFMDHLFTHCPHLKTLELEGCALKQRILSTENFPLEELRFKKCIFFGRFLNQLSMTVPEVNRLYLNQNTYCAKLCKSLSGYSDAYCSNAALEINMSHTKIGSIIFEGCRLRQTPYYIKLNVVSQKVHYYYRYDGELHNSNQKEYPKADDEDEEYMRIDIRCLSKPDFEFN